MTGPLKESAQQAMLWSAGVSLARDVAQFAQMLILVRLLDPAIYGTAGLATTIVNFIGLLSFQSLVAHTLQVRPGQPVDYQQHFWAGLIINPLLFLVATLSAFAVGTLDGYSHLQPVIHLLSLTFLLSVPVDLRIKMLERDQNWTRLRTLNLGHLAVSVTAGISLALAGAGVYALVAPGLIAAFVFVADLFVLAGWRPNGPVSFKGYGEAARFALTRAGSGALNSSRALLQNSLVTHQFGFAAFGILGRAEGLANLFCGRVAQEIGGALYPVVTRAEAASARFARIAGLMLIAVAWTVIPIAIFFSFHAAQVVDLVYGDKWHEAVVLVPPAMAAGIGVAVGATAYRLLLANNQVGDCLRSDLFAFVLYVGAVLSLVSSGVYSLLVGIAAVQAVVAMVLLALLVRGLGLRPFAIARALVPPLLASLGGMGAAWALELIAGAALPAWAILVVAAIAFGAAFVLVLRVAFVATLAELVGYLPLSTRIARLLRLGPSPS